MPILHKGLLLALDPIHIGAGGHRLGGVDMTVVREPGTDVPKIPGTSLHGAARSYAAMQCESLRCAGQGQARRRPDGTPVPDSDHCGACAVCYTFGFTRTTASGERSQAGTVNFFDAQLLAFPVRSMAGPVWVTTASRLEEGGLHVLSPPVLPEESVALSWTWAPLRVNLGWLLLDKAETVLHIELPGEFASVEWSRISTRLALVDDRLFGHVVNSNMEVRTSVSINPETGAAEEGALFSYEAIPRGAVLTFDLLEDDYRRSFPKASQAAWETPSKVALAGLGMSKWLGIGGMGTRGFGRIGILGEPWVVKP